MILGKYTRSISQRRNRIRVFSEPKPTPNRKVIVSLDKKVRKVHSTPSSWKIRFKSCRSHLEGNFDEVDVAEPCLLAETSFLFPAKKKEVTIFLLQNLMFFYYLYYVISFFFCILFHANSFQNSSFLSEVRIDIGRRGIFKILGIW